MMRNIDKEEIYIHYLKQLLDLDKETNLDNFEIFEFISPHFQKHGKVKTTKRNARLGDNASVLEKSKNQTPQMQEILVLGTNNFRLKMKASFVNIFKP